MGSRERDLRLQAVDQKQRRVLPRTETVRRDAEQLELSSSFWNAPGGGLARWRAQFCYGPKYREFRSAEDQRDEGNIGVEWAPCHVGVGICDLCDPQPPPPNRRSRRAAAR